MNKNIVKRKIDIGEINKRVDNGLITIKRHPFLDLRILNYTKKTQHRRIWDRYTTICRGLIIDWENNILNNPFTKFYNLGECEKLTIKNLPAEVPSVTEKLDGMLGILYEESDRKCGKEGSGAIATRGMFDSDHAKWATKWLRSKGYCMEDFKDDYTYLLEIIYPGSKIVVNYKNRAELVLLAVRNNNNGYELDHVAEAQELGLSYAKEYNFDGVDDIIEFLKNKKGAESEGFVCKYSNGLRIKIKSADYLRLHKILTGVSTKDIWMSLRFKGNVDDIVELVPDEFFDWVKKVETELRLSHLEVLKKAALIAMEANKLDNRLEKSEYIARHCNDEVYGDIGGIAFLLMDDMMDDAIRVAWRKVKPTQRIIYTI